MSISKELEQKIHDTINSLAQQHIKPTYEAIRGAGGYSYNSIKPALKSWRDQKDAATDEQAEQKASEIVVDEAVKAQIVSQLDTMVTDLLVSVTTQAQQKAAERLTLERTIHEDAISSLSAEVSDLEHYIATIEADNEQLKTDQAAFDIANRTLTQQLEQTITDNQRLQRDITSVEDDNEQLKNSHQRLITDITKATAETATLTEQLTEKKAKVVTLSLQLSDRQTQSNEQLTHIAQLKGEIKGYEKTDQQLRGEIETLKARHDNFVTQIATLTEQNKQLLHNVDDLQLAQQTEAELTGVERKKSAPARQTEADRKIVAKP